MKPNTLLSSGTSLLMLSTTASASPTAPVSAAPNTTAQPIITPGTGHVNLGELVPPERQREEQADHYLFNMTLESFISLRDQRYPSYFFWESDGCSQSPDYPLGFPFLPACYRHDFGYDQYKKVCTTTTISNLMTLSSITSIPSSHTIQLHLVLTLCAPAKQVHVSKQGQN